jgi:predicted permease
VRHPAVGRAGAVEAIMSTPTSRLVAFARAIHRTLLILAPVDVRRAYRSEMIDTFAAAAADARRRGRLAVVRLLVGEIADLATARRANRPASLPLPAIDRTATGSVRRREWARPYAWRQAWRSLTRRPAFLVAATLTLSFGTGITTAVFALVDTVLIKPLPFPDADRLTTLMETTPVAREKTSLLAPGRLEEWNRLNHTFVAMSGSYAENVTDTSGNEPERLEGRRVAARFFTVFGMPMIVGRGFTNDEEQANGPGVAVISERFWTRRFQRDPTALGRALVIGGRSYQIVGVVPQRFVSAQSFASSTTDVWLPAQFGAFMLTMRDARFITGAARLKPGVSVDEGLRDVMSVQQALGRQFPKTDDGWSAEIRPYKDARIGSARKGLVLVFGAVAALWIIAVANIAGLTLVQVHRRARELAIRAALGASRPQVVGTVIREGLLVAFIGGALGTGLGWWLVTILRTLLTRTPRIYELAFDWRAVAFVAGTSVLAACVFSLVPAFGATRSQITRTLADGSRGVAGGRHNLQKALVVAQVAVSVLLVGSATLLLRTYYNLTHIDTGLDASQVVTFHVAARWDEDRTRVGQLQAQLLGRLAELPHVQGVGMTSFLPATMATLRYQVRVQGLTGPNADGTMTVGVRMISSGYLPAIHVPLVAGEWCPAPSTEATPLTVMVNQRFVDVFAPGQQLAGRILRMVMATAEARITGVVGNFVEDGHAATVAPYIYTCNRLGAWPDPEYVARTLDAGAFATDLRRIVREIDPGRAIFGLRPLQDVLDAALEQPRMDAAMLGVFAVSALALAAIGLYSLFMLVVSERAREIAVRLAVGAAPHEMIRLVMLGAGRLMAGGIVLGLALTLAADRLLRTVLFGVTTLDASALASAALTLAIVAIIAVAGPALKAARIAPIEALRRE